MADLRWGFEALGDNGNRVETPGFYVDGIPVAFQVPTEQLPQSVLKKTPPDNLPVYSANPFPFGSSPLSKFPIKL